MIWHRQNSGCWQVFGKPLPSPEPNRPLKLNESLEQIRAIGSFRWPNPKAHKVYNRTDGYGYHVYEYTSPEQFMKIYAPDKGLDFELDPRQP